MMILLVAKALDQPVTIGLVLEVGLGVAGIIGAVALFCGVLIFFGNAFKD